MKNHIEKIVDKVLRPAVGMDGGAIDILEATEKLVHLRLHQNCSGCPGFEYTKNYLVLPALRKELGESIQIQIDNSILLNKVLTKS